VGTRSKTLVLATVGGLAGDITFRAAQRTGHPAATSAVCLVAAALTYRLADPGAEHGPERTRELLAVGATAVTGIASSLVPPRARHRVLAAGWLSHAVFDMVHHRNSGSLLPRWYPALCAGFDVAVAARHQQSALSESR